MLLFLLSNGLNAAYLNLSNIGISVTNAYLTNLMYAVKLYCFSEQLWITRCRIVMSGEFDVNPGPKRDSCQSESFSICHWNLKASFLTAYLSVNKFDIVCLSETFANSNILADGETLQIPGYIIARVDHPSNTKSDGVCVYYKPPLPLKLLDIKYLQKCINLQLIICDNLCSFIILYRSPSQTHDNFESLMKNFELNLDKINKKNPFSTVALRDFNAKSQTWFKNNKTSYEGSKLDI